MGINLGKTDLVQVIRAAMDAVKPAADAKGVDFVTDLDEDASEFCGDPDRLQQVVWNLLSNAVKFTPRGGRIDISLKRVQSDVEIQVRDSGIGIASEFLPHVFDRFRQADSSITRTQGGLGLGLAIVRHLVEVHGGTVDASSDGEGKGATFTVRMPVRAVVANTGSEDRAVARRDSTLLSGVDVLLVEDEADAQELVSDLLGQYGATVRAVDSGEAAITAIQERRPDVLLSDIGLPRDDGYSLIHRVREFDRTLPAAALTAYAGADDHQRALSAGFHAHVTKPIEPDDLVLLVATLAGRSTADGTRSITPIEIRPIAFPL
jgi:CheY-like chemotaxis protein/anti-sigma regulatory factor (Ser/Thr protein kinase)